ncbi:MAG: cell division protein FtsA, partial [Lachnospiraceae bacterium]
GKGANIHSTIKKDDIIEVIESTAGQPAHMEIRELPEFRSTLVIEINGKQVILPKFASVNGGLQSEFYEIQDKDAIEFLNYYTVEQILTFMDISVKVPRSYYVNNAVADLATRVYENFTVKMEERETTLLEDSPVETEGKKISAKEEETGVEKPMKSLQSGLSRQMIVVVNQSPVVLKGKAKYIFVDVFDYISFDLSKPQGAIVTTLNGKPAQFMEELHDGDILEIYWRTI